MSGAEIGAIIMAFGGLLTAFATMRSSARNSDLEIVKQTIATQQVISADLQKQLADARVHIARLEEQNEAKDKLIERLRKDLNAAHEQIRKLQDASDE